MRDCSLITSRGKRYDITNIQQDQLGNDKFRLIQYLITAVQQNSFKSTEDIT